MQRRLICGTRGGVSSAESEWARVLSLVPFTVFYVRVLLESPSLLRIKWRGAVNAYDPEVNAPGVGLNSGRGGSEAVGRRVAAPGDFILLLCADRLLLGKFYRYTGAGCQARPSEEAKQCNASKEAKRVRRLN